MSGPLRSSTATSDPMLDNFLDWLLGSDAAARFGATHWDRTPLHVERADPSYFASLLTLDDLDRMVTSGQIPASHFDLAKDSTPLAKETFCAGSDVRVARALQLHRDGATIILRALQRWSASLQALCAVTEATLGASAQANVYVTPPGHQSTPPHWDTHDLFILQIHGSKLWRLFDSADRFPLDDQRFSPDRFDLGDLRQEITLQPGDVLYLPRGTIHEPRPERYSVHIALGVLVARWGDFLSEIVRVASERHVALRKTFVPSGVVDHGLPDSALMEALTLLQDPAFAAEAARRMEEAFLASREPQLSGQLRSVAAPNPLTSGSRVAHRRPDPHRVARLNGSVRLIWSRGATSVPVEHEAFLRFVSETSDFVIADIPGDVADSVKVATISALVDDGFLERVT